MDIENIEMEGEMESTVVVFLTIPESTIRQATLMLHVEHNVELHLN